MRILKVGITGGIGSGKTTVCKIFETLGIPVYYADERAKWLMVNDSGLKQSIRQLLGEEAYDKEGRLDRGFIAGVVFQSPELLERLNALVHPAVALDLEKWQNQQTGAPYTLKEAALIYESGSNRLLDKIIVVTAPLEMRIRRVMERDGVSWESVEARISRQMPEAEKVRMADFVIYNDGSRSLIGQVIEVHGKLVADGSR